VRVTDVAPGEVALERRGNSLHLTIVVNRGADEIECEVMPDTNPATLATRASPKATLRMAPELGGAENGLYSASATLLALSVESLVPTPIEIDATLLLESEASRAAAPASLGPGETAGLRRTVLPRREGPDSGAARHERMRFDRVRVLGTGAMGEVELARDNDIRRTVAVKRIRDEASCADALMRFADEVRIVGQLEHPSIVPIYDVGRDENGKIYLVMKHLSGQTMEQIIEQVRSGDPAARERFGLSERVRLFLAVLDAIRYAHARGIVHRDLKPANIMIGPYGEVTVLDWGIAKPIDRKQAATGVQALAHTAVESADARLLESRLGALCGTPLYMSPEQAAGRNHEVDERSDVYSLSIVLFEWLVLEHPLARKETVTEVLAAIISHDYRDAELREMIFRANVPMDYMTLFRHGLARDKAIRFQSVEELETEVQKILAGRVAVACHLTLAKRVAHETIHWIDRNPKAYSLLFFLFVLSGLAGIVFSIVRLIV